MVVGLGENRSNGRRCILITLDEDDIVDLAAKGIELNTETHPGFPKDLELCLVFAGDQTTIELARAAYPDAQLIPLGAPTPKMRES